VPKARASRALVVPYRACPGCAAPESTLRTVSWIEEPLIRGGGYGGARLTILRYCGLCGWEMVCEVSECRPMRRKLAVAA
jgi:hypothetical protein